MPLQTWTSVATVTEAASTSASIRKDRTNASATRDTRCEPTVAPANPVCWLPSYLFINI